MESKPQPNQGEGRKKNTKALEKAISAHQSGAVYEKVIKDKEMFDIEENQKFTKE